MLTIKVLRHGYGYDCGSYELWNNNQYIGHVCFNRMRDLRRGIKRLIGNMKPDSFKVLWP